MSQSSIWQNISQAGCGGLRHGNAKQPLVVMIQPATTVCKCCLALWYLLLRAPRDRTEAKICSKT